tara:strand:- start:344 stop:790 length:447 start_codon:yes stop_codon:yes gene_type:complete
MKSDSYWRGKFKRFFLILIFLAFLFFQTDFQKLQALPMANYQRLPVIEELRLRVPSEFKATWLKAEKEIWEPWLSSKDGFLGRQIFWNKEKEEALILVNWESKKLWKSISLREVNQVQEEFEKIVKVSLNLNENPFELIYEGELSKQI